MRNRGKSVETTAVQVYEWIVRKMLLNNLSLAAALLLCGTAQAALRPAFVVLGPDTNLAAVVREVEFAGGRVRQRVPPRVFVADLPASVNLALRPGVESVYTSALPLDRLKPLGLLAVAAGTQWNRRMVEETRAPGVTGFGAMRVLVAQRSLPAPANLRLRAAGGAVEASWDPLDSALYYEVETGASPDFSNAVRTRTVRPMVRVPALSASPSVRVRAVDPAGAEEAQNDVFGSWSEIATGVANPVNPGAAHGTPVLTSPLPGSRTEGFTLILEWIADSDATDYRVQVARDAGFANLVFDEIVTGGEYACPGPALREGDRLFWRVRRWDAAGSPWSEAREARIGAPRHTQSDTFVNPEAPR